MQRATPGSFHTDTQFKNEPHQFPQPSGSSFTSCVTAAPPAKRITFYKSGDTQFKGVKMAIHKRSFKCFDALLDDLSQKVPLPFGVRTITTPRGTHSIKHLEQLEDGGCYLCSDRRHVKPINIEAAGKRPAVWNHHSPPHNPRRKPSRPEGAPSGHQHRHPKRIMLVKNNDPAVRRSIILSRRTARSLRVFMDEISELMQCHVKKLYTLEGRKIDSIQGLMQCPSVLVCVGREPFRPLLMENLRKLSDEKLPGVGTRSRSSICSEDHESKKNVNFGLETKKSIIHPRSDSSNRSTRFSLSSEKSYRGLCVTPGQSACVSACPYVKEVAGNDDIQKRVLVNEDGSLSVEMKVRFRLFNDETLQWSTEIKKSSTKLNESGSVKESGRRYLEAKAECSEPDSNSPSETEEAFAAKLHEKHLKESVCQNCCNHCQEYDIWRNPMHKDQEACKSPSSSGSSQKIVRKKTSVDSTHTVSRSSEEYTEHVVEKSSCFQQTLEEGDTRVEYCARSRCCSRSEVSSTVVRSKGRRSCEDGCESNTKGKCFFGDVREPTTEVPQTPPNEVTEERAISAVSNSSKVLESLKDDQDDDYDDLPPSISRASNWSQSDHLESDAQSRCIRCCDCQASPRSQLSPRPPSKVSSCSIHSLRSKKYKATLTAPEKANGFMNHTDRTEGITSAFSNTSSRSHACHCKNKLSSSVASGRHCRAEGRYSQASCKSGGQTNTLVSTASGALEICEDEKDQENGSLGGMSAGAVPSRRSAKSSECLWCDECRRPGNAKETKPQKSEEDVANAQEKSAANAQENCETLNNNKPDGKTTKERSETALSKHSNTSAKNSTNSKQSNCIAHEKCCVRMSEYTEVEPAEERTKSAMSTKSKASSKSTRSEQNCNTSEREATPVSSLSERGEVEKNSPDKTSASSTTQLKSKPSCSERTSRSCSSDDLEKMPSKVLNSHGDKSETAATQEYTMLNNHCEQDTPLVQEQKSASAMFNKSNPSSENVPHASETEEPFHKSPVKTCCKLIETKATQDSIPADVQCEKESNVTTEERSCDSLSSYSKRSAKSNASSKHSDMQKKEDNDNISSTSRVSCRSHRSSNNVPETAITSVIKKTEKCATPEIMSKRSISALSQTSAVSQKSNTCSERSVKIATPDYPASKEMSTKMENGKEMMQNALTVTSPSPGRSPSPSRTKSAKNTKMKQTNSRTPSAMSVTSKVSSESQRSSKCDCHRSSSGNLRESKSKNQKEDVKDESEERVVSRLSGISQLSAQSSVNNMKPLCSQLDEPLSPTSTASVSLGLPEEHKCNDFDEQSTSDMSVFREKFEIVNDVKVEERPKTATSVTSAKTEKSRTSHCITCKTPLETALPVSPEQVRSAELKKSISGNQLNENSIRVPSALSLSSSRVSQRSAKNAKNASVAVSNSSQAEMTEMDNTSNSIPVTFTKHDQSERASGKITPASDCSKVSEHSEKSKKDPSTKETDKRSKCSTQCLEINGLDIKCDGHNDGSLKTFKPDKRSVKKDTSRSHCDSSDSVLSRALSAADLLREIVVNARPVSRGSKSVASSINVEMTDNKSERSSKKKHRKLSNTSEQNNEEQCSIMPSCLPNASPTEVVKDWLENNPIDGPDYEMDVEFTENIIKTQGDKEPSEEDKNEAQEHIIEVEDPPEKDVEEPADQNHVQEENNVSCVEMQSCDERPHNESSKLNSSPQAVGKKEDSEKHSRVQVMKVLLGPKLDRCRSLPEVSPVYGRKLSQSAQGLLDCLANLRLIESDSQNGKHPKYNEVMMILQSLWLQEPSEDEQKKQNKKEHQSAEDEFNLQSSSGVDVSSGSTGSIKGSMAEKSETAQGKITQIPELEVSKQDKEDEDEVEDERNSTSAPCEGFNASNDLSHSITPDIAERVQGSPENKEVDDSQENKVLPPDAEEFDNSTEKKCESDQTQQISSNKGSGNESSVMKSPENTSSETPPSVQRASLTKRTSQDPDPVWVLGLLKKLEKQFMLHYANAMAEFKVKWDLEDNEMLNTMITELKEEVHKRIQSSINRELQKIQSRSGRGPRPPEKALSRESTVQTEQRRRRLRVMRNTSITLSSSEENYTASGTEFSDQRSDDEYCPCDACMKKKMASKGVQRAEALSLAPVMMEFDLCKILQMKKDPAKPAERKKKDQSSANRTCTADKEDNNLEVVHEEVEEVTGNLRSCSIGVEDQGTDEKDNIAAHDNGNNEEEQCDESNGEKQERERAEGEEGEKEDKEEKPENKEEVEVDVKEDTKEKEEVESVGEAEHGEISIEEAEEVNATGGDAEEGDDKKDSSNRDIAEVGDVENNDTEQERGKEEIETNMETEEKNEAMEIVEETESGVEDKAPEDEMEDKASEGEMEDKTPEGEMEDKAQEGEMEDEAAEGEMEDKAPKGEMEDKAPEGEMEDEAPEGEMEDEAPEGEMEDEAPEGEMEDEAPEDEMEDKAPEDEMEDKAPEGEMEDKAPEGEMEDKAPEGEMEDKAPEGEMEDKAPEGEMEGKAPEDEMEDKAPKGEMEEAETGETVNDETTEEDQPTTENITGASKPKKCNLSESAENEKETLNEKSTSETNDDGNQAESAEDEAEKDETSDAGEDEDQPKTSEVNVEVEVRECETDKHSSVEETPTEDTEKNTSTESSGVDSEITRTSVESQPGSVENSTSQTVQAKLNSLQSFMESIESQGDMVVITKQPSYRESCELHEPENQKDFGNGLFEWQVSPKIRKRDNKQKKLKDNDIDE